MNSKNNLVIDSQFGGNGDVWMRLLGLYGMAGLFPELQIVVLIPKFLRSLAHFTFGDRLLVTDKNENDICLKYSSLGLRHLLKGILRGYRYILPYQRAVVQDKKRKGIKDALNIALFSVVDYLNLVHIPAWKYINSYQGYLDVIGIPKFKDVTYDTFIKQMEDDFKIIYARLQENLPVSSQLRIPEDLKYKTIVFPNGTSRQFIPNWWAKKYLPHAYFAFFFKDAEATKFKELGLNVIYFYNEPGDIIHLSKNANFTISTDSFPSHLLQSATTKCAITITEVLRSRIISPTFKGTIIDSRVQCHPCLHLDRKNHPTCAAGYSECLNWSHDSYINDVLSSIPTVTSNAGV